MRLSFIGSVETLHRSPEHIAATSFDVTVAVCFANSSDTLGATIRSLAGQTTTTPFELLLVSNGTTDDSIATALEHSAGMAVRVLRCESVGYDANARNVSMVEAAGAKLLFVDADDTVGPDYVAAMADALDRAPLVTSSWDTALLNPTRHAPHGQRPARTLLPFSKEGWTYAGAGTLGMRREVPAAIGGFDPSLRYASNNEWCFRAYAAHLPITAAPGAFVHVRHRADLRGGLRQRYRWGLWEVAAERAAGAYGLPRTSALAVASRYLGAVRSLLTARTAHDLWFVLLDLGHAAGRVVGSVRFRRRHEALTDGGAHATAPERTHRGPSGMTHMAGQRAS